MRHSWPDELTVRFVQKTERTCAKCGLVKVTRHEPHPPYHWIEFWRDGEQIKRFSGSTPPCEATEVKN